MITAQQIAAAVQTLVAAARPERVILFGSHARGEQREDSDLDLLIIERQVEDRAREMVRLRRALRPLRIPVDLLVFSSEDVQRWGEQPGALNRARTTSGVEVKVTPRALTARSNSNAAPYFSGRSRGEKLLYYERGEHIWRASAAYSLITRRPKCLSIGSKSRSL